MSMLCEETEYGSFGTCIAFAAVLPAKV